MSNWKDNVATAPVVAPALQPAAVLAAKLSVAIHEGHIETRSLDFAKSLLAGFSRYGQFTAKQLPHVERLLAEKVIVVVVADTPPAANYSKLISWFDYLTDNVAFPKLHLQLENKPFKIQRAGNGSKTPGALNLTDGKPFGENKWYGRVNRDGTLFLANDGKHIAPIIEALLAELNSDPKGVCAKYGLDTGNCACCGRLLTNESSIELGIGPICAEKFGF